MIQLIKKYGIIICFVLLTLLNFSFTFFKEKAKDQIVFTHTQEGKEEGKKEEVSSYATEAKDPLIQATDVYDEKPRQVQETVSSSSQEPVVIPVFVCGEVINPGVYYVNTSGIVNDVVELAGGLKESADRNRINLAAQLVPNEKIYVPKIGEEIDKIENSYENKEEGSHAISMKESTDSNTEENVININTASQSLLEQLPGIGAAKAQAIIEYREQNGGFSTIEELQNVSGIGQKTFDKLRSLVCT